jgi:hypothetical protein
MEIGLWFHLCKSAMAAGFALFFFLLFFFLFFQIDAISKSIWRVQIGELAQAVTGGGTQAEPGSPFRLAEAGQPLQSCPRASSTGQRPGTFIGGWGFSTSTLAIPAIPRLLASPLRFLTACAPELDAS